MTTYLVIHLWGPLQGWGAEGAIGEVRNHSNRPSKSAIVGLLGAALGYERGDARLHELQNAIHLAVQTLKAGRAFTDFHTVQSPKSQHKANWQNRYEEVHHAKAMNTIVSRRDYAIDACYRVAIWSKHNPLETIETLAKALAKPVFSLYLGRRACPLGMPLIQTMVEAPDLPTALSKISDSNCTQIKSAWNLFNETVGKALAIHEDELSGRAGHIYSDIALDHKNLLPARNQQRRDLRIGSEHRYFETRTEYVYHLKYKQKED
jgi:CRISPR system Cascade subunit CasD